VVQVSDYTETVFPHLVSILLRWMCKTARNTRSFIPDGTLCVGIHAGVFVNNRLHNMKLYKNAGYFYEACPNTNKSNVFVIKKMFPAFKNIIVI